eukprot:NODE_184_length_15718_cov_0.161342.p6 type:complete len:254 gc:universal NODE_184_length_15718_cov_0.161342:15595-14834(-)
MFRPGFVSLQFCSIPKMYDFNIPYQSQQQNLIMIEKCKKMGYDTIGWTITIDDSQNLDQILKELQLNKVPCTIQQYFRLNIKTAKANFSFNKIKSKFDIVSVEPMSAQAFHGACEHMPIDIIAIPNSKIEVRDSFLKMAYTRHIRIEFVYGNTIANESYQRQFFTNLGFISRSRCRKRLMISCGSTELRKSTDTQAILIISGFNVEQAKLATQDLKSLLLKFKTKEVHGGAIEIIKKRPKDEDLESKKKAKLE